MLLSFSQKCKWLDTDEFCDCASGRARGTGDPVQSQRLGYEARRSRQTFVHRIYAKTPRSAAIKTSVGLQLQRASVGLSCTVQLHAVAIRREGALCPWLSYGGSLIFLV